MDIELISAIISIIALAIATFSIVIAFAFYFKTSELHTKMVTTLAKIETISETIYSGTYDLIKDAWPHLWENEPSDSIISKRDDVYQKMKEEILEETQNNIKKNIESIKINGIKEEELKNKLTRLEEKVAITTEKMFSEMDQVEKAENSIRKMNPEDHKFLKYIHLHFKDKTFTFFNLMSKVKTDLGYSKTKTVIMLDGLISKGLLKANYEDRKRSFYLPQHVIDFFKIFGDSNPFPC